MGSLMTMSSLVVNETIIFFAYDYTSKLRSVYIDIGEVPWDEDQVRALPVWSGASVQIEWRKNIGPLFNRYFLTVTQNKEDFGDLYEMVIQNLIENIQTSASEALFAIVYKVFERWKSFFKKGGFKRLSDEQQRGLFGELHLISQWINSHPGQPPLLIESWTGPAKGRIDFVGKKAGIEIKTTLDTLTRNIRISNEKQLQPTKAVQDIYLYVCYLEQSKTHGITLDEITEKVKYQLYNYSHGLALKFEELLYDVGYKTGDYNEVRFSVSEEAAYKVNGQFPQINAKELPLGVNRVSYNIDLSHCEPFRTEVQDIYSLI